MQTIANVFDCPVENQDHVFRQFERRRRWGHNQVHRVYCSLKLNRRRKGKRRLPTRNPVSLQVSQAMSECWSADFMSDALWDGRRYRTFVDIRD
jgi:putative transposase